MREMKDSGVEWIGEIPKEWEVIPMRRIGNFSASGIDKLIKDNEELVRIVNYVDVYRNSNLILNNKEYMTVSASKEKIKKNLICEGDLIFTPSSETVEDIGLSALVNENIPNTSFSYHVLRFVFKRDVNKSYKKYLCNNHYVQNCFSSKATGTIRKTLSRADFNDQVVFLPPLTTQQKIADYLDRKCSKIDEIITKQGQVIEKLKAYKLSIITESVTKGLNPNVKMKDSGVEWIGEIPEHWEVCKFKTVYSYSKGLPITKADLLEKGIAVISYGQIHSKKCNGLHVSDELVRYVSDCYLKSNPNSISNVGDILFADTSEDYLGIGNFIYNDFNDILFAGYHTIIAKPKTKKVTSKYQAFLFKTDIWRSQLRSIANGIKVFSITQKMLNKIYLLLPSQIEQQSIADYLDIKCTEIEKAIEKKQAIIDKLTAYKKSLIYEVVTGKKEV